MKVNRVVLIPVGVVLFLIFGILGFGIMFAPGSYVNGERYELDFPEEKVIHAINKFKKDHPSFNVPKVTIPGSGLLEIEDGRDENSYWYDIYFYYAEQNIIVHTWTRPLTKDKTTFAFIGINSGLMLGNWQEVNNDLGFFENRTVKKEFEERILKEIESNLK